jgi:hypothetical protein
MPSQPALVYGSDLIQQNDGVSSQAGFSCSKQNLGRIQAFIEFRTDGGNDGQRAEVVRDIVLNDDCGTRLPDLRPNRWIEAHQVNISSLRD